MSARNCPVSLGIGALRSVSRAEGGPRSLGKEAVDGVRWSHWRPSSQRREATPAPSAPPTGRASWRPRGFDVYAGTVKEGLSFQADLLATSGATSLSVSGALTDLECQSEGPASRCTFTATEDGEADLTVKAVDGPAEYTLDFKSIE